MTLRDYTANVISASKVVPDGNFKDSKASGVWDINEALDLIKGGNWPNAANINPAAFVDGLFSIDLYAGNGSTQQITNGLNLSGKGGLVWSKERSTNIYNHALVDNVSNKFIMSDNSSAGANASTEISSFNTDGFTLHGTGDYNNQNNRTYVSWTFRKQPKFFDIVTYTGNNATQTVNHNLGSVPGMIIVKRLDDAGNWGVKHRSIDATDGVFLNNTDQRYDNATYWGDTEPTSTQFTVGTTHSVDSASYVAYLFAHNNNDGGFGEPEDQDIIKCDSYTGNGSNTGSNSVTLGFEPQLVMIKRADSSGNWVVVDNMRGMFVNGTGNDTILRWNSTSDESSLAQSVLEPTATGFKLRSAGGDFNGNGGTYIYMAIRRGGMQTPSVASSVFSIDTKGSSAPYFDSNHIVDMALVKSAGATGDWYNYARIIGEKYLATNSTAAEANASEAGFDFMDGHIDSDWGGTNAHSWMWKRARGYFDVVAYSGTGSARNLSHNLGVAPEMMWIKPRDLSYQWSVYHKDVSNSSPYYELKLNGNDALANSGNTNAPFAGNPTATTIPLPSGTASASNRSGYNYIAYLFATVAGVSKVGSYTGNATSDRVIDCGFTNGAKFVLIKDVGQNGTNWQIFDTTRGLTSTKAELLRLNTTAAQIPNGSPTQDYHNLIEPDSSGFKLNHTSALQVNASGVDYIFYAIANDPS